MFENFVSFYLSPQNQDNFAARKKLSNKFILYMSVTVILFAVTMLGTSYEIRAAGSDSQQASAICQAVRKTGDGRCSVDENNRTINVIMHTSPSEAKKICAGMVSEISGLFRFSQSWSIKIYRLMGDDEPTSVCYI